MGLLGGVLVFAIVAVSSIIVVNTINPIIDEGRDLQSFSEAKKILETIDSSLNQILFEAPGARRSVDVNLREGRLIFSGGDDTIKIRLDDIDLFTPGIRRQEGNVLVTSGAQVDAYESDIDGDGNTDLILENSAVIFAVRKIGTPASHAVVNTSSMITLIRNKASGVDVLKPKSAIFLNETTETSYGIGFTELTQSSDSITSASIRAYINATEGNRTYDAIFSLGPSQDFIEFHVANVR